MQQVTGCSRIGAVPACCRSQLLRPVQHHSRHIPFQPAVVRHSLQSSRKRACTCSAGDQDSKIQTNSEDDVRPEISKTKLADKGADNEVPKLGLAGTIATWALLIVSTVRLVSIAGGSCRLTSEYFTATRLVYSATLGVCSFCLEVPCFSPFHGHSCQICNHWMQTVQKSSPTFRHNIQSQQGIWRVVCAQPLQNSGTL